MGHIDPDIFASELVKHLTKAPTFLGPENSASPLSPSPTPTKGNNQKSYNVKR